MILITKPFLPPMEEYNKYLEGIWQRKWLTNMGPLSEELELKLKEHLNVKNLLFVTNGTLALQMAIKALDLKGEIITTPYSFVATTSSIVWEGCQPVFVDIDANTLNIDASKIEEAITPRTSAILATHVYGNPCDVEAIGEIAGKYNLKVIYDGAHSFGVEIYGKSIFEYGDISICSLHATKHYHSIEGGLVIARDAGVLEKLSYIRNFGIKGPDSFAELGINGKNSEFHAAMGLANLKYLSQILEKRRLLTETYRRNLVELKAVSPAWNTEMTENYAFFPLIFDSEELMHKCIRELTNHNIFTRRYFFPSLGNSLPYLNKLDFGITDYICKRAVCLPLYYDLSVEDVNLISKILMQTQSISRHNSKRIFLEQGVG